MLRIDSITQSKDSAEECVRLEVLEDTNLSGYALIAEIKVLQTEGGQPDDSGQVLLHFLKFPDWKVGKGDYVRIYSGKGEPTTTINLLMTRTHMFFWNKESSLWAKGAGNIELVEIKEASGPVG